METPPHIPRPRLVLSVGIVGHRANKLAEQDLGPVCESLRTIYRQIDRGLAAVAGSSGAGVYAPQPPLVRLLSGLAEGADRLAVGEAPPTWRLEAVLPMPRADYALDFAGAGEESPALAEFRRLLERMSSVTELPRLTPELTPAERAAQYSLLGDFLARQIDVLIAVWDGQAAAGPGGTGAVVEQAIALGCLVVWINPSESGLPRLLEGDRAASAPLEHSRPLAETVLNDTLKAMLLPALAEEAVTDDDAGDEPPLPVYFHSEWPGALHLAIGYSVLRLLGGGRRWKWPVRYASYQELADAWTPFLEGVTGRNADATGDSFDARVRNVLLPRSIWADALAWYYGQLYRSAYVTTFVLGGLAVPVGLCYLFFANSPVVLDIKAGFATVELLIILIVVLLVQLGSRQKWHRLWLETREMSELLRLGRSLAYVGSLKQLTDGAAAGKGGGATLPVIYARATFREIGLPNAVLDSGYLRRVLGTTLETELREQQEYHRKNIAELEGIDHALHRIGNACFAATVAVTAIFLAGWVVDLVAFSGAAEGTHGEVEGATGWAEWFHELLENVIKPSASILAAGLPAFGAAFAGIRAQSNFGELVRRSEATLEDLTDVAEQIGGMIDNAGRTIGLPSAAGVLLDFAHAMAVDLGGWRQLFIQKPLVLPG